MFNFGGSIRGFGEHPKIGAAMGLDFEFRRYLKHFKGPKLHVFTAITLHANREGWAWPSIGQLEEETGYEPSTISDAIVDLRKTVINGQRVMLIVKERIKGRFARNKYLIFPSDAEVKEFEKVEEDAAKTTVPEIPVRLDQNGSTSAAAPVVTEDSQKKSLPEKDQNLKESESPIVVEGENARKRATPPPQKPTDDKSKVVDQVKSEDKLRRAAPPKSAAVQDGLKTPPPPSSARPPSAPVPSEALFEALGDVCFDNPISHKLQATRVAMEQVLVEVMAAESDLTADRLRAFGAWWMRTTHFKSRKRPYLNQVTRSWAEFQGAEPVLTVPQDAVEEYYADDDYVPLPRVVRPPVDDKAVSVWKAVIGQLEVQLNKATFNTWLGNIRLVEFDQDEDTWYYVAAVPHNYTKDWLDKHLVVSMKETLAAIGKTLFKVEKKADLEVIIAEPEETDVRSSYRRAAAEARVAQQ